ncbi:MAG: helicase-exonuclease AddAB subunit AddA [Clostridiaceae bacterium]
MGNKWTNEQLEAIETRGCNLLVAAAAGSGKTAVLVERIIKIITDKENPVDIDKLLVVTFTSAAAGEMRERIADAISKELEKDPDSRVLQRQLTLLSKSSITTMHSFCLDVIKNNFHYIDLDPSFRISDDTEGTLMKLEALTEIFEELFEKEDRGFLSLLDAYGTGKNDKKLQDLVLNLYEFSMSGPWPERWLQEKAEEFNIINEVELENTQWIKLLKKLTEIEIDSIIKNLETARNLAENNSGLQPYAENLKEDIVIISDLIDKLKQSSLSEIFTAVNNIEFSKLKRVLSKNVEDPKVQDKIKRIRDKSKKSIVGISQEIFNSPPEDILKDLKETYPLMKALSRLVINFKVAYEAKKRERGVLDFNDLEHLCLKILTDEQNISRPSSVALGFREKFTEVLVDEYQDSNNVQETIISLVSRKETDNPNVFMVGDVKQSIYRFRQAKPELFLNKYNTYGTECGSKNKKIMLYKNFRSRESVINGANFIFKEIMSEALGELEYTDDEALNLGACYAQPDQYDIDFAGNIELHIADKSADEGNGDSEEENHDIEVEEEDLTGVQLEARIVGKRIKELMSAKVDKTYMVIDKSTGKYRKVRYKDIVILLRATKSWAEVFSAELGALGIPVYSDAGTGYFETIEIRTILSLLQIIDNPLQDVPLLAALKSPVFSFTAEELGDLRILGEDKYFYEVIEEIAQDKKKVSGEFKEKCISFIESLDKWRKKVMYTPIDEFIWYLYMDTSYYGFAGGMVNGVQRQANLKILFQRARQFESTSFKGLFNFINFIHKLKKSSGDMGSAKILGENEDVVRIMSIHKSKGLEFPVVFISGCGKRFNLMDLNKDVMFHDELGLGPQFINPEQRITYPSIAKNAIKKKILLETLSEEMRILYVGLTRAKEKLIITGSVNNFHRNIEKWSSSASISEGGIPPYELIKMRSFLDWIATAICRHRDGAVLRGSEYQTEGIIDDDSRWDIKLWKRSDFSENEAVPDEDTIEEKQLFINNDSDSTDKEVERRLGFKYKFKESSFFPSNVSVSELKKRAYKDSNEVTHNLYKEELEVKPKFLQKERGLSPAERGTVIHFFMQKIDLSAGNSYNELKAKVEELVSKELLRRDEAEVINIKKVINFLNSTLGKRMSQALKEGREVRRELPFYTEISALEFDRDLPEKYKDETLRLQGVIDAYFEEEDGIVLLDYKTDYAEENSLSEIVERYRIQLSYYSMALERMTGKKVKERYLYLFSVNKEIKII